jgi:hypothetical protein
MGITVIILIGLVGVLVLTLFSNPLTEVISKNNKLIDSLRSNKLFHHYGATGVLMFLLNAFLFFFTMLVLYGLQWLAIPFLHIIVMFLAVGASLFVWLTINLAWQGEAKDRLKVGVIGSSFYFFLTAFFLYKYVTIEPMFPGDDPFMRAIGFLFAVIVALVAFVTCFFLTGFVRGKSFR